jgi:hypothetical protein
MDVLVVIASILAVISTLTYYTTLSGWPNPFYSYAEYAYLGSVMGWSTVIALNYIIDRGVTPLTQGALTPIGGLILGILMWTRFSKKYGYIARIPISISVGIGLGLTLRTVIFSDFIQQIQRTIMPVWTGEPINSFNNLVTIVSMIATMLFFFFSIERKGPLKGIAEIGEYSIFIAFGTYFAANFMGRFGLLIGRINFLLAPDKMITSLTVSIILLILLILMKKTNTLEKFMPE